jgi:methanogenic corrinoid protein MtbC1
MEVNGRNMSDELVKLMSDLKEDEALENVKKRIEKGEDALKILAEARSAMEIVGKRFAAGEYFIPDLIYSGEILKEISEIVRPKMKGQAEVERIGTIVLGTVAGDIHDIGKDIVAFMLDISGFEVIDLGIDVPIQKFVDTLKQTRAPVLALSGFLTLAFESMKETVEAVKAAGLRDKVKIMIGGGQIDEEVRRYTGADAFRPDAVSAVTLAKEWIK